LKKEKVAKNTSLYLLLKKKELEKFCGSVKEIFLEGKAINKKKPLGKFNEFGRVYGGLKLKFKNNNFFLKLVMDKKDLSLIYNLKNLRKKDEKELNSEDILSYNLNVLPHDFKIFRNFLKRKSFFLQSRLYFLKFLDYSRINFFFDTVFSSSNFEFFAPDDSFDEMSIRPRFKYFLFYESFNVFLKNLRVNQCDFFKSVKRRKALRYKAGGKWRKLRYRYVRMNDDIGEVFEDFEFYSYKNIFNNINHFFFFNIFNNEKFKYFFIGRFFPIILIFFLI
jgi:hypothetical protein